MTIHFTTFATEVGVCAIAWSGRGVVGLQLPERSEAATRSRLKRRHPGGDEAPPTDDVRQAIAAIVALIAGEPNDLGFVRLDFEDVPDFERRVYDVARTVQPGATITYGEIARRIGDPGAARAVGKALGSNPFPIVVPCHRVLGADGKIGGFSANGGVETKVRLLSIEKARTSDAPALFGDLPLAVKPRRSRRSDR